MEPNYALAQRIRAFRKLKGLTQLELAQRLDVSIAIVGAIERGTRKADSRILRQIADALGVDAKELAAIELRKEEA
ncbi:MAG: helix-turn-helix transcriptional regulator [Paenibacillaceae bacterium]|uniref:helix-turn-helix domain-containing protein n=1 Tax=Paenibacillus cymbidii TaxID=1639034 RepID=UPI0010820944|nr:helix-turn-helix transcriptional regulator [Paenibacillus cymbidii]MBO9605938.1 helix-turn-helix transcriptional regulator [Paenibacillaceae bacterium]